MAKSYIKELHEQIEAQQDALEIQGYEAAIILTDLEDVLMPDVLISQAAQILLQMLMEQNEHQKKNGRSKKSDLFRDRLTKLLEINKELGNLSSANQRLKYQNRYIAARNVLLVQQLAEVNAKLEKQIAIDKF